MLTNEKKTEGVVLNSKGDGVVIVTRSGKTGKVVEKKTATPKATTPKTAKVAKVVKEKVAKPVPAPKQPKEKKPVVHAPVATIGDNGRASKTGARLFTNDAGQKITVQGHVPTTVDIILAVLKDEEEAGDKKLNRKEVAAKYNIGIGTVSDILSGQPVIVNKLAKAGYTHPHPRNENGAKVGVSRKHQEAAPVTQESVAAAS